MILILCHAADGDVIVEAVEAAVDWSGFVGIFVNNSLADDSGVALENMVRFATACQPHLVPGGHVVNVGRHSATALPDGSTTSLEAALNDLDRLIASVAAVTTGMLVA